MSGQPWTPAQAEQLRALYPEHTAAAVGQLLGRLPGSIYAKAKLLGLEKSAAFLASDRSGRIRRGRQHPQMVATQFRPGLTPWNKGAHYQAGGRSAETQFKLGARAGQAARNYLPIGSLRISKDGYLERKFTDEPALMPARRWVGVHRQVWEQANGPIPASHIIVFRPGRKTRVLALITPETLECISRAENARRNHPRSKSPELARLVQLKGAITRQVNRINREAEEVAA